MEDPILDDDCRINYNVDFGIDDAYKDSCSTYNKCSFIKRILINLPQDESIITYIEREYYIDYVFDLDKSLIGKVYIEIGRDITVGIQLLKKLKPIPLWCKRPL